VNWTCISGGSGLHMAARENSMELLELLLSQPDVDFNLWNQYNYTPLELACERGHANIVRRLCQHREIKIGFSSSALQLAIHCNRVGCVEALKEFACYRTDWKDRVGYFGLPKRTPVANAAAKGFAEVLEVCRTWISARSQPC